MEEKGVMMGTYEEALEEEAPEDAPEVVEPEDEPVVEPEEAAVVEPEAPEVALTATVEPPEMVDADWPTQLLSPLIQKHILTLFI